MDKQELQRQCDNYNSVIVESTDGIDCAICGNKQFIKIIEGEYAVVVECDCRQQHKNKQLIAKSNLGELFYTCTFDNFETKTEWQKSVKELALRYLKDGIEEKKWLFFGGQVGSGKTHICTAIVAELMKRGKEAYYMLWRDEISRLKADVNSAEYQSAMAKLSNVTVLYIDDFFKVKTLPTDADMQIMFQIINNRYIRRLTTIFSSELSVRRITELDEAMGSRINQMVGEYAVFIKPDTTKNMRNAQ